MGTTKADRESIREWSEREDATKRERERVCVCVYVCVGVWVCGCVVATGEAEPEQTGVCVMEECVTEAQRESQGQRERKREREEQLLGVARPAITSSTACSSCARPVRSAAERVSPPSCDEREEKRVNRIPTSFLALHYVLSALSPLCSRSAPSPRPVKREKEREERER